jgi:hypothetical protein
MVQVYLSCLYLNNFFLIDKIHLIKIISLNQHRSWGIRRDLTEHSVYQSTDIHFKIRVDTTIW